MKRTLLLLLPVCLMVGAAVNAQPLPSLGELADKAFREGYDHHLAGRDSEAIDAYSRSIRIRATNPSVWFNRGLVYQKQASQALSTELYLKAISDFSEALKLKPGDPGYLKSRGDSYYALRAIDTRKYPPLAVADYTELLKLTPKDGLTYRRRGEAYQEMGQTAKAVADLSKAIAIDPNDRAAYFRRGTIRWSHSMPGAKEDFETVLKLDPKDGTARKWLDTINSTAVKPKPSPSPAVVAVVPRPKPTPASTPSSVTKQVLSSNVSPASSGPWDGPLREAKKLLAAGEADKALTYLQSEIAKVPAKHQEALVNLMNTRHRSLLREQVARAYLAKKDYATSIDTMTNALTDLLDAVSADLAALNAQAKTIPDRGVITAFYEMRIPTATDLFDMGKRGMDMYKDAALPEDLKFRPLAIGFLKVGAGEIVAGLYRNSASAHILNAEECRGRLARGCGPGSADDKTIKEATIALEKINIAIATAPALKELYGVRARIHRFLGNTSAAAEDEAKSVR